MKIGIVKMCVEHRNTEPRIRAIMIDASETITVLTLYLPFLLSSQKS